MLYFSVILHGDGIRILHDAETAGALGFEPCNDPNSDNPVIGFYAARLVRARNEEDAIEAAKAVLIAEWSRPPFVNINKGSPPQLEVDEVTRIGLTSYLRRRRGKGHTFYTATSDDDA